MLLNLSTLLRLAICHANILVGSCGPRALAASMPLAQLLDDLDLLNPFGLNHLEH